MASWGTTLTPALYEQMRRQVASIYAAPSCNPIAPTLWGMPLRSSHLFPIQSGCKRCDETGAGDDSTYCPWCKGAGAVKTVGMLVDRGVTTMITEPLPKLFQPSFPNGLVPEPQLCRGLPLTKSP